MNSTCHPYVAHDDADAVDSDFDRPTVLAADYAHSAVLHANATDAVDAGAGNDYARAFACDRNGWHWLVARARSDSWGAGCCCCSPNPPVMSVEVCKNRN